MNKNVELRDKIIFGKYEPEKYSGGHRPFRCSYETMKALVDNNFIEPDECQNYSPYTKDFMDILDGIDGVEFIAYAISPDRSDYRVTIEGADVDIEENDHDTLCFLVESFRSADEFNVEHIGDRYHLHAWWD